MKLLGVHHFQVTIPIGAEELAREFYCGLLGLVEIQKPREVLKRGGFWLELEGIQIHVGAYDQPKSPESKEHFALLVEGLDEWKHRFESAGVEAEMGTSVPGLRRFDIRDPFNNRIEFLEETAE